MQQSRYTISECRAVAGECTSNPLLNSTKITIMNEDQIIVTLISVAVLCYGLLILMGKCDKIIISKHNSIIPFNIEKYNIYKLRFLQGGMLVICSILLAITYFCGNIYVLPWILVPLVIIEEILRYTWARKRD